MYYCMEVDKVAFGTQGHKRSLIGNGILLLLCAPSPHYIATDYSGAPHTPRLPHQLYAIEVELLESTLQQQTL